MKGERLFYNSRIRHLTDVMRFTARTPTAKEIGRATDISNELVKLYNSGKHLSEIGRKYCLPVLAIKEAINVGIQRITALGRTRQTS
ncbi:MAG: hypothetical protein M1422_07360 [Candidatus Thermoplasmatota archaeon]|nr:hypothetical protein [Candidatus Thermoplasmatota archaeon]